LNEKKYFVKETLGDDVHNYPEVRKGHSLVKYGSKVFIFGGINLSGDVRIINNENALNFNNLDSPE
jgi:hypothetical protein